MPTVASSPEASPRLRRELVCVNRMARAGMLALVVLFIATFAGASPASAYWRASGSGSRTATVAMLLPPTNVSAPASSNSDVAVSWVGSAGNVVPTTLKEAIGAAGAAVTGPASRAAVLGPVTVQRQDAYGTAVTAGTSVTVRVLDAFGNPTDSPGQVTLQSNCTLKGTLIRALSAGAVSFPDLEIAGKATGCTLTASSGTLTGEPSNSFSAD